MEKAKRFLTFYRKSINPPYVAKDLIVFILTIGAPILILIAVVFTISHTKQSEVRAAAPPKDISYNVGVLVVRYFPTNDGVYLDTSVTGSDTPAGTTVAQIRSKVNRMNSETLTGLTDGSKYHGYKDPNATAALKLKKKKENCWLLSSRSFFQNDYCYCKAYGDGNNYADNCWYKVLVSH